MTLELKMQAAFKRAIETVGFAAFKALPLFGSNHCKQAESEDRKAA